jgi:hypothetical protein
MPNWSFNHLQIIGKQDEIDKCLNSVKTKESAFDFDAVIPRPENISDWYTWNIEHWGTKWNAQPSSGDTIVAERIPTGAEIWFDTPWTPPVPVLLELSKKFPELEFQLYFTEEWMGEGLAQFKNGETLLYGHAKSVDLLSESLLGRETPLQQAYRSLFAIPGRGESGLMKWEIIPPANSDRGTKALEVANESS